MKVPTRDFSAPTRGKYYFKFVQKLFYIVMSLLVFFGLVQFYSSWYKHGKYLLFQKDGTKKNTKPVGNDTKSQNPIVVKTFDSNASWSQGDPQSTEILQGSYPIEDVNGKKQAWVQKDSKIYLEGGTGKALHIDDMCPLRIIKKQMGRFETLQKKIAQ